MKYKEFCEKHDRYRSSYGLCIRGWKKCLQYVEDKNFDFEVQMDIEEFLRDFFEIEDANIRHFIEFNDCVNLAQRYISRFPEISKVLQIDLRIWL